MRLARLDGLRALAIAAVLLAHHEFFSLGWIGVDLFFVLSGFLITSILRRDREHPAYWRTFYTKRVTRIFPAALIFIAVTAWLIHASWRSLVPYLIFMGNVVASLSSGGVFRLNVLWSLAVEEHFYLVFPFAVRYLSRRSLACVLVAVLLLEPALRALATPHLHRYVPIYFLTCFRLDGLAMGALLSLALEKDDLTRRIRRYAGFASAATWTALLILTLRFQSFSREANSLVFNTFGYSLVALASVTLLAHVHGNPRSLISRTLSHRAIVFLGLISYSMYLFHTTVMFALAPRISWDMRRVAPVSIPVTIVLSWLVYRVVESPCINAGHRLAKRLRAQRDQPDLMYSAGGS